MAQSLRKGGSQNTDLEQVLATALLFQKYFYADFGVILYACEIAGLDPILLTLKGTAAQHV